jgi:hypothetical protein
MCVLILLYMCVLLLLYYIRVRMDSDGRLALIDGQVLMYSNMCPLDTTIRVSSYYYMCVRILLYT